MFVFLAQKSLDFDSSGIMRVTLASFFFFFLTHLIPVFIILTLISGFTLIFQEASSHRSPDVISFVDHYRF